MSASLNLRTEWLDAPDISTPEIAATWSRFELWSGNDCLTQVETRNGTFRRGVYGTIFPMAEWIVENWWLLGFDSRPSAVPVRYWRWRNLRSQPWLRQHNLRAAGNGMAWPDLTLVPEGELTRIRWAADADPGIGPVRFVASGTRLAPSAELASGLADIVNMVLERLDEAGLHKTRLAEDWAAIGGLDSDEQAFCGASAQLGLDPYTLSDELADEVLAVAQQLPESLAADFFDNADPDALSDAGRWTRAALAAAGEAAQDSERDLGGLRLVTNDVPQTSPARPWESGYAMARRMREALGTPATSPIRIAPWVSLRAIGQQSRGIPGVAAVVEDRCGVVLSGQLAGSGRGFAQARALGRALAQPMKNAFLLSTTRGGEEKVARAFAAELLAPASGIRELLLAFRNNDDVAFESVADHFGVSPLLIRYQYDNQVADAA